MLHKFVNCNVIINSVQIDNPNSYLLALHVHWLLVRGKQYAGPVRPLLRNMGLYFMCAIGIGRNFRPVPSLYKLFYGPEGLALAYGLSRFI